MLKKILTALVFLIFYETSYSQEQQYYQVKADSILKALPGVKKDSVKLNAYIKLSFISLVMRKPDDVKRYTQSALSISKHIKLYEGKTGDYLVLAEIQRLFDEQKEREYLLLALNEAKKTDNWQVVAYTCRYLGYNYQATDFKSAIKYYKESADIYMRHKKYDEYCQSALWLAQVYLDKYKLKEVIDLSNTILGVAEKHKFEKHAVHTSAILVQVYAILGNEEKTVEYSLDILKKTETGKFPVINRCSIFSYLASYYKSKKDNKKAHEYTEKLKNCKNVNYTPTDAILFKAGAFAMEGDTIKAFAEYDKAAKLAFSKRNYTALTKIGAAYYSLGNYNKALVCHRQSLSIVNERYMPKPIAECEAYLGATCLAVFKANNNRALLNEGITLLERAVVFYKKVQDFGMLASVAYQLSEAYELAGKDKLALSAHKDFATYKDSAWDRSNREALITKQAQYEYGQKEALLKASQKAALDKEHTNRNYAYAGIAVFVLISIGAGVAYSRKRKDNRIIAVEKQRSDDLLRNILPEEVAEELKAKGEASARYYDHVSILFTDFVGFTKLSEKFSPEELIAELNYCFKAFDGIITKHNIEKIKTIGDSYMAVSGLPSGNADHAINAVNAAIEMRNFIDNYKTERKAQGKVYFEMRTGINSGQVVAGIVGIKKFAYDVWGDAVNIASRMETNGVAGKVNISQSTFELVKDAYKTEYRGEIDAKGKGHIKMYFIEHNQPDMDFNGARQFILQKQDEELPAHLTYHSINHVRDVYDAVCRHIEALGITGKDADLLQTAALFHDSGFMAQAQGHEEISCSFAQQYLPGFGYSGEDIDVVCGMIRATKIPQTPQTPLEEILADADLDYLGRIDFWPISNQLFKEMEHSGVVKTEEDWNHMQVRFFESHHYFTDNAKAWRNATKEENLNSIKHKLTNP